SSGSKSIDLGSIAWTAPASSRMTRTLPPSQAVSAAMAWSGGVPGPGSVGRVPVGLVTARLSVGVKGTARAAAARALVFLLVNIFGFFSFVLMRLVRSGVIDDAPRRWRRGAFRGVAGPAHS